MMTGLKELKKAYLYVKQGSQTQIHRRATEKMLSDPQFIRKKLMRAAIYKKSVIETPDVKQPLDSRQAQLTHPKNGHTSIFVL
jgi:hypothetical protein